MGLQLCTTCLGIPQAPGLHCNPRSPARHHWRLLADGVGDQVCQHCHAHQGERGGKGQMPSLLAFYWSQNVWPVSSNLALSEWVSWLYTEGDEAGWWKGMLSRPLLLRVQAHIAFLPLSIQDGSSLPVKQFQYTGWPEEGVPDTGSGLIDLIGQVQKWQRNSGDKPIVVHCRLVYRD